MPGIQLERKPESSVSQHGLTEYLEPLNLFNDMCRSSLGPRGKVKFIQNCVGGCLTVTSTSKRLLSSVSIQTPVLKVLTSAAQSHLSTYGDGGTFLASLASSLILKGINSGIKPKILSEIFEALLTYSVDFMNSEDFLYRQPANFSDVYFMSSFVRNILGTKVLCRLTSEGKKHLTVLILECFLNSVSETENCSPSDNVYLMTDHAGNVDCSQTYPGILLAAPELSKFRQTPLSLPSVSCDGKSALKVALITASMSGDLEEISELKFEIEGDADVDSTVVDQLACFCDELAQTGVSVVLCQRVVHPRLKRQLRTKGLLVIDRIGQQPIRYIAKLSGASPVSCLDTFLQEAQFGWVDDVTHTIINNKSYIQLTKGGKPVTTLMLTHPQEQPLCEIKEVTSAALTSLDYLLQQPYVLCGGGCWQAGLVQHIKHVVDCDGQIFSDKLELPKRTVTAACDLFTEALLDCMGQSGSQALMFNKTNGHLYYNSKSEQFQPGYQHSSEKYCGCGLMKLGEDVNLTELRIGKEDSVYEPNVWNSDAESEGNKKSVIWDSWSVRVNALKMAVLSASAVLRIGQVMETG